MTDWSRKDRFKVTLTLKTPVGDVAGGSWSQLTGAEFDSEETLFHPGGMAAPVALGGRPTFGTLVLERGYDPLADIALVKAMISYRGVCKASVVKQALDVDGYAIDGTSITYTGTLKQFQPPEVDAESNDAAKLHCEFTVEGAA